ncbi:hypothetical protein MKX01_011272 [Papaver californicum]|nr:hypothetical protein MKX01_011272 [Papaver californicum]
MGRPVKLALYLLIFLCISEGLLHLGFVSREEQIPVSLPRKHSRKMPRKIVDVTPSNFDQAFEKFNSENGRIKFILFLADIDPSTSVSWCPDCVRAEPVIYKKLEESSSDVLLLRAYVGDRPTWRTPNHPWRTDSRFNLKGVPTLVRWENGSVQGRLEDHEAHVQSKIETLLS